MYKNFEDYIWGVMGLHGSWERMIFDLTEQLRNLIIKPNLSEVMEIDPSKLVPNRFYLIKYDFNGNPLWCPILALDYKVHKNNHILYGINLEYLPPRYKMLLFDKIFKQVYAEMDLIAQKELVRDEATLSFLSFEFMYKMLKVNGNMEWSITAWTIKNFLGQFKIKKAYLCSIKILPQIMFSDWKRYNTGDMIELQKKLYGEESVKLGEIIEQYQKLLEEYEADSILYHKKVALFREKLKLFKD